MKWALYNLLFALTFPFLLPGFLLRMLRRGGYAARLGDRFALYPPSVAARFRQPGKRPVWIHAVSVGEVQADQDLIGALAAELMCEAILRAVSGAESAYGFPAAKDLKFGRIG